MLNLLASLVKKPESTHPEELQGSELLDRFESLKKASGGETSLSLCLAGAGLIVGMSSLFLPKMDRNIAFYSTTIGFGMSVAASVLGGSATKKKETAGELSEVLGGLAAERMDSDLDNRLTPQPIGPTEAQKISEYVDKIELEMSAADRAISNWLQSQLGNVPAVAYYAWQCVDGSKKPEWRELFPTTSDAKTILAMTLCQMTGSNGVLEDLWELVGEDDQKMLRNRPSLMMVCPAVLVSVGGPAESKSGLTDVEKLNAMWECESPEDHD